MRRGKALLKVGKGQEWGIENEYGQNVLLMLSNFFNGTKMWRFKLCQTNYLNPSFIIQKE